MADLRLENGELVQKVFAVDLFGNAVSSAVLPSGTDRSGLITSGGTAQELAPLNPIRASLMGQNISAGDLWISENGEPAAIDAAGSFKISSFECFAVRTNRAISIVGATTGQKFTVTET